MRYSVANRQPHRESTAIDDRLEKARLLIGVRRYDLARELLINYLGGAGDDAEALALLAYASVELAYNDEAQHHAERAIAVAADSYHAHFMLAFVLLKRGRIEAAMSSVSEALRLAPEDADAFGLRAQISLRQGRWPAALADAEEGLRIDPEHQACTLMRGSALRALGRTARSLRVLQDQLARTPEHAPTHAHQGLNEMDRGSRRRALDHFRESLRLDPNSEFARLGAQTAFKARHWFYRPFQTSLWHSRHFPSWELSILFLGYLLFRLALAASPLQLPFRVLAIVYVALALLVWFASPIANVLLLSHPHGRNVVSRREVVGGLIVCGLLAAAFASMTAGLVGRELLVVVGVVLAGLCVPLTYLFHLGARRPRRAIAMFSAVCCVVGAGCIASAVRAEGEPDSRGGVGLLVAHMILCVFLSQLVALPARARNQRTAAKTTTRTRRTGAHR